MEVLTALLVILATIVAYAVYSAHKINQYWKERGVPHKKPLLFIGNSLNAVLGRGALLRENRQEVVKMFPDAPVIGFYDFVKPILIVKDLDLVQRVLIKDFTYFNDRPFGVDEEKFPHLSNLANMKGKRWKSLRNKMIPVFTTGKLRLMFGQMSALADAVMGNINPRDENILKCVDIKKFLDCFSIDIIGSTAFGIDIGALRDGDNEFARMGKQMFNWKFNLRFMAMYNFPRICKRLGIGLNSPTISKYFQGIVKQTLEQRASSGVHRNDFVNLMLTLKEKGSLEIDKEEGTDDYLEWEDGSLPDNEKVEISDALILSNAFLFIMAGFDIVGTLLSLFCLDLSQNLDAQEKLRNELKQSLANRKGVFDYDVIRDTPYLEMCVKETMRLHTLNGAIVRECTKEYTFPGTNVTLKPGDYCEIPVHAIHMDPEVYPDPERFDPDRFGPDVSHHSCDWLPFGDGPRVCIAMRFVITEVKCAMAKLLLKYEFRLNSKTQLPVIPEPRTIMFKARTPLYFDLKKVA